MGVVRHRRQNRRLSPPAAAASIITILLLLTSSSVASLTQLFIGGGGGKGGARAESIAPAKKQGGIGSSPPSCRSKCGRCWPCKAVHVPIQPGMSLPLEYYPEAWRCKCGNKLYMP